jgi:hypothetical protein
MIIEKLIIRHIQIQMQIYLQMNPLITSMNKENILQKNLSEEIKIETVKTHRIMKILQCEIIFQKMRVKANGATPVTKKKTLKTLIYKTNKQNKGLS